MVLLILFQDFLFSSHYYFDNYIEIKKKFCDTKKDFCDIQEYYYLFQLKYALNLHISYSCGL